MYWIMELSGGTYLEFLWLWLIVAKVIHYYVREGCEIELKVGDLSKIKRVESVKLETVKCGADKADTVEGAVQNNQYPWVGVLFYSLYNGLGETRSVTTVVLIHLEFVIANSADIAPMPKRAFREKARVLLGEGWERGGRRVRNYIVHPEYGETINSVAIVHLAQPVRNYLEKLQKRVVPMVEVPADMCRNFYIERSLYEKKRRPSFVKCAISLAEREPCVWGAGAALGTRDVWGRWQLLGLGVRGPGCGAPARFLDMLHYYPWIEDCLDKFQRITISQIHDHKYVLRSGVAFGTLMRFGDCEDHEKQNLIYRDSVNLKVDNNNDKHIKYNMTIFDTVQYTCIVFQLQYASASAILRVQHFCRRGQGGAACYAYKGTRFDIAVDVLFTEHCNLDVRAYGMHVNMTLLDLELWKWEEGTYYDDFSLQPQEYRGPQDMTLFGFEPLDDRMWIPDYDRWSTTPWSFQTTTARFTQSADDAGFLESFYYVPTTAVPTTTTTKRNLKFFSKKTRSPWYWVQDAAQFFNDVGNYFEGFWGRLSSLFR